MIGRNFSDIYIAACGEHFDSHNSGRRHEKQCRACKCAMAGDPNDVIAALRQALREATLKHIPATDPLYRTAVKLLNETEPK
jgi:hypothetical protein